MRILHVDTGKEFRGGQRQAKILHFGLIENGIESFFLANKYGSLVKDIPDAIEFDYKSEWSLRAHMQFKKVIDEIKPDIVQTHDGRAVLFASLYKNNYKIVETRRVSYPISFLSRKFKYAKVDQHIAVSQDTANYLNKYFKNINVIHSCIELNRFNKQINDVLINKKTYNIVFVGAFSKQKGIDVLIKAFNSIERDDIALHLVGAGKLLDDMKKIAGKNITFYGERKDVEDFYLNATFIIVPSVDGEGSSGVIKEAIVAKKLVISSDLDANCELVEDKKNGVLFKNKDVNDLKNKIELVLNNQITINKEEIEKYALLFDCKFLIEKYITIYNNFKIYKEL